MDISKLIDDRSEQYGDPCIQFQQIESALLALLPPDKPRHTGVEHCMRQILMKMSRALQTPFNKDHYLDIQGYAEIWSRIVAQDNPEMLVRTLDTKLTIQTSGYPHE